MVVEHSALYHFRKAVAIYIYPVLAGLYIVGDWAQTRQLKRGERPHAIEELFRLSDRELPTPPKPDDKKKKQQ